MGRTEWLSPGTVATVTSADVAWTNASNAATENGSVASVTLAATLSAEVLFANNFDFSTVPDGSFVSLVETRTVRRFTGAGDPTDSEGTTLYSASGVAISGSSRFAATTMTGTLAETLYTVTGSPYPPAPIAKATLLTATFGAGLLVGNASVFDACTVECDVIQVRITYVEPTKAGGVGSKARLLGLI